MSNDSYRQILRSTSIIGGASVINILIGLVRIKIAALVLGPAGIGLIGLLNNLMSTAANVATLGMGTVGTRQIAEAAGRNDHHAIAAARRALFWAALLLAVAGAAIFWLLRDVLATQVLNNPAMTSQVAWLALGVALTVAGSAQGALLNGLRHIGDLARASVYASALATLLGVVTLLLWREKGLIAYILLTPLAGFLLAHWYVARLPKVQSPPTPLHEIRRQWHTLARLGIAFMLAGLVGTLGQLAVRTMVQNQLGTASLGHFEASWTISITYIAFVLGAMGTDYYPRLTAVINDHTAVNQLVNEQTEIAVLLAGPVLLAMLGLAPWVINLLYSSQFAEAATLLRWQILGDILKVLTWPLGFIILAAGQGRTFLITETMAMAIFVLSTWLGLPYLGLPAAGVGFLIMYLIFLPMMYWLARRKTGFRWTSRVFVQSATLLLSGISIAAIAAVHIWAGAAIGVAMSIIFGLYTLQQLAHIVVLPSPVHRINRSFHKIVMAIRSWHDQARQ